MVSTERGMAELCSLENAFPNIGVKSGMPFVGGTDSSSTKEERRAARKKAKKAKGCTDPDRQVARMDDVDEAKDTAPTREAFQGPVAPTTAVRSFPAYFGKGADDIEEQFSDYSATPGDDPNYRLEPDIASTFDARGVHKAMGLSLPDPNLSDRWKPITESGVTTAFGNPVPTVGAARPGWASIPELQEPERLHKGPMHDESWVSKGDKDVILQKMNMLVGRLDEIDKRRLQNTQMELLIFVGAGVLMLFTLDVLTRR